MADLAAQHTTNGEPMTNTEVPIHNESGCGICGSTGRHAHPYDEWKEALDAVAQAWEPVAQVPEWLVQRQAADEGLTR